MKNTSKRIQNYFDRIDYMYNQQIEVLKENALQDKEKVKLRKIELEKLKDDTSKFQSNIKT